MSIELRPITAANVRDALRLELAGGQDKFVAPNAVSLAQAGVTASAWPRLVVEGDDPVGFVMLELTDTTVFVWRLMIAASHQRRGLGRLVMLRVLEIARSWGFDKIAVSCVEGDGGPRPFYEDLGFVACGEEDGETVLELPLEPMDEATGRHALRYEAVGRELAQAVLHARTAANHLLEGEVPRCTAHAWSTTGHLARANRELAALAEAHAARSEV